MKMPKWIPQSSRPMGFGHEWDQLTPDQRRSDFVWNLVLGIGIPVVIITVGSFLS